MKRIVLLIALLFVVQPSQADEPKQLIDVAYGNHPRQVLDFYQAKSDKPTPVVFYIHGGGWQGGDKKTNPKAFLDKGISVVAINYRYGAHAFGLPNFQSLIDNRESVLKWIKEYSPIEHVSKDDPPIALFYRGEVPVVGASPKDPTHSGIMGVKLEECLKAVDVDVVLVHPDRPHPMYKNSTEYLIDRLLK